ncbi:WAT1-related protein At5g40240-like [Mercurialis annua]|uniref:WAT1-related protein At5g40240-like n=1 Tax=Mercurialis annua TaxID=3986 RepID=UPI002160B37E|nr:WAT1-related protein At5g40240-like [Mercurialis annua]
MGTALTFIGMVLVILAQVGSLVINKLAFSNGINKYVLLVYTNALSTLILLPCSFIFHRSQRPPLSFSVLLRIFLLALIGVVLNIFSSVGIEYSSPVLATAMLNLIPAFTFALTLILRMEKLDWRSRSSVAKLLGTIVSITGAFVVTFYKGATLLKTPKSSWILGGFFLTAESFLISVWYILQTFILRSFPAVVTVMFYYCFFCTIVCGVYSFVVVNDVDAWRLRLDIGLVALLYSTIVTTVFKNTLCAWCLWKAGPLYVSMFKPLGIILAVLLDFVFLGESLHLGSVIGASVIVVGFYLVMWGKAKEEYVIDHDTDLGRKAPLLPTKIKSEIVVA